MPRSKLVTDRQVLKSLKIVKLRGVKELIIGFQGSPVTGIFGLNGCGKTTILQAIICLFRAKNVENTKMSRFFKHTTGNTWTDSEYYADIDYVQLSGKKKMPMSKTFKYCKPRSEWIPRQAQKPDREVIYMPLSQCIPDIEKVSKDKVTFIPLEGEYIDDQIATAATQILGDQFEKLQVNKTDKLDCFTVVKKGIKCHSFNLGAGEQRVFRVLQTLYRVPPYSLIVIDELDLTLHSAALRSLIRIMVNEASKPERNLQIVFSSHRQDLMINPSYNVRYILNTEKQTFCLDNPSEDCYEQLSGKAVQYLTLYVEDDLAKAIVIKCLKESGNYKHAKVCRFGSITNCVRLAAGIVCQHDNTNALEDVLFICDGDVPEYTEENRLKKLIDSVLSGNDKYLQDYRDKIFSIIKHFNSPKTKEGYLRPEEIIHDALTTLSADSSNNPELLRDSAEIIRVVDPHDYVSLLLDKGHSLEAIVELFSKTEQWITYVHDIKEWITRRTDAHKSSLGT